MEWEKAQYDPRMQDVLDRYFRETGVVQIGAGITVPTMLWSQTPITKIEDLAGLKIRSPGLVLHKTLEVTGANPITMSIAEVEEALKRGTVDALITDLPFGLERGLGDFVAYFNNWELAAAFANGFYVNAEVFDALPRDLQDALRAAGKQLGREMVLNAEQRQRMAYLWLAVAKTELIAPDKGEMERLATMLTPVYEEWLKIAGPYGPEVLAIAAEHGTGPAAKMAAELAAK